MMISGCRLYARLHEAYYWVIRDELSIPYVIHVVLVALCKCREDKSNHRETTKGE
jgi:hypothetical protein